MSVLVWRTDASGAFDYFNQAFVDYTDCPREALVRDGWHQLLDPLYAADNLDAWQSAFADKQNVTMELRIRRHDGEFRWMLSTGQPIFDRAGSFDGYIGTCVGIHERRMAEFSLARTATRFETYTHQARDGIVYYEFEQPIDPQAASDEISEQVGNGRAIEFNPTAVSVLGFGDLGHFSGSKLKDLLNTDLPDATAFIERFVANKFSLHDFEYARTSPRSATQWLLLNAEAVRDSGSVTGAWVNYRDVTERMVMVNDLKRMQFAVDHVGEAVFLIHRDAQFIYVNQAAATLFGYTTHELCTMRVDDIDAEISTDRFVEIWEAIAFDAAPRIFRTTGRRADGSLFPAELKMDIVSSAGAGLCCVFVSDITERINAEITRTRFASFIEQTQDAILRYEYTEPIPADLDIESAIEHHFAAIVTNCNEKAADLYNFENADAMVGLAFGDFVSRDDPLARQALREFVLNGFELSDHEVAYTRPRGNDGWVRLDARGEKEAGRYVGLWASVRDITSEKQAAEALRKSDSKRAEFLAQTQEAVVYYRYSPAIAIDSPREMIIDQIFASEVEECNDAAANLYGLKSRKGLIGRRYDDLVDRDDPALLKLLNRYVDNGFTVTQYELEFHISQAETKWLIFEAIGSVENGYCYGA